MTILKRNSAELAKCRATASQRMNAETLYREIHDCFNEFMLTYAKRPNLITINADIAIVLINANFDNVIASPLGSEFNSIDGVKFEYRHDTEYDYVLE